MRGTFGYSLVDRENASAGVRTGRFLATSLEPVVGGLEWVPPVRPARVTPKSHGATTKQGRPKKNKSRKTIYRTCPEPTPEVQASSWARDDNTGLPSHRRGEARLRKSDCGLKSRELLHHSSRKHKSRDPRQLVFQRLQTEQQPDTCCNAEL